MDPKVVDRLARSVRTELAKDSSMVGAEGDTPILDFLKDLIVELGPMLLGCLGSPQKALAEAKKPGVATRARVRLHVWAKLRKSGTEDFYAAPVCDAIWAAAKKATVADFQAMQIAV